ncbi:MAG TPA: LacI family DNA-binding transcriptional regulator [Woeseiaceae bacterium]|jgi:LacI family transcriptional regulator
MPKATIFEVAKLAGVSIKTVSRVVNHEPNVRESTRERVERAIAKLNYRPDQSARNLASHRSHLIGLVYDDPAAYELPSAGYVIQLQQGALKACSAAMSQLLILPCNYRKAQVLAQLKSLIEETRPEGIILAAPLSNMPKVVRAIEETGTAYVRMSPGEANGEHYSVATNDREVSAEMTRYLASLGHRKIAFITGHPNHKAVAKRFDGYRDGLKDSKLNFSERLVAAGDNSIGSGESAAEELLSQEQPPTAIFAANDDMAVGVVRVANRLGIDIPAELSVAGFDDIALARQIFPALTTIRQPLAEMAERAARALIEGKNDAAAIKGTEIVTSSLQIRESTGPAPGE